jgi:trehalose/maltose hydrolase-like predicted phosphorylase
MIIEVARYLTSITAYDRHDGRYGIAGIVGPDEYHDAYPMRPSPACVTTPIPT